MCNLALYVYTYSTTHDHQFIITLFPLFLSSRPPQHTPCVSVCAVEKKERREALDTIEIWLILPVVICLFQGLSHACLRITASAGICAWLITSDVICRKNLAVYPYYWITWRNAKLIHEPTGRSPSQAVGNHRRETPSE